MGADLGNADQRAFHLGRENVDTPNFQHVVAAADDFMHPGGGAPAGAGLIIDPGDILGAVTEHGDPPLGQIGHHQLSGIARRQRLSRFRVDDLTQEMILIDM